MTGRFFALEGVDGAGKSTQAALLAESPGREGRDSLVVREPGGTRLGEAIRGLLLDRGDLPIGPESELLLFLASRVQLYEERIAPALAAGRIVISDRYHLSTIVYQGIGRRLGETRVAALCAQVLGRRVPDLHIVIDLPLETCLERMPGKRDRIESERALLVRVAEGFRTTSGAPGDRIVRIDGRGDAAAVAARIRKAVGDAL